MAGIKDFQEWSDDFNGTVATFPTSADPASPWLVDDVSSSGTPTYTKGTSEAVLTLVSTNEAEVVALHFGDALDFDIDLIQSIEMRVKIGAATFTSGSILTFGLGSARSDTANDVAANAWFRMEGANSTTVVYCETDDGTRDVDDISSGVTLGTTYKRFYIDFTGGKSSVKFYIDGARVAASQVFDMSGYSAGLQPIIQLQKAANTNVDSVTIDYVSVICKRS
ncbi:hypothetical protein VN12_19565 [Pirellula sp. SH-Sr6A]|uniref:hypothetical protein n=1 Tax=Pirellula sp. SH-Sr6A TaxID=1632865 RepID=UPI00078CA4FE|nr:hypothetical protein [Pirellula sp. SH-Sr6A]AMV30907.1 hypothetical protein VN12_02245 [Pirellula sp. SH-Sr6A]AMV34333.1 hypothetical protein VN12_19565 [Pirellula sp. SH-Sr6A]